MILKRKVEEPRRKLGKESTPENTNFSSCAFQSPPVFRQREKKHQDAEEEEDDSTL